MMCIDQCESRIQLDNALLRIAELEQKIKEAETDTQLANARIRISELEQRVAEAEEMNFRKDIELNWLKEKERLSKQREFGHSKDSNPDQLALFHFNEAEQLAKPTAKEPELVPASHEPVKPTRKRKAPRERKHLWENLPVKRIVHSLPESECSCPECGTDRRKMSEEVSRRLGVIPAQFYVEETVREVYVCDGCQKSGEHSPITTAEAPKAAIEKSIASPSVLAYIAALKYCDGLPLYRIEQMLRRMDLGISRQNLANWMIQVSDLWLKLIYDELHEELLSRSVAHSDATELQVLREPGRAPQTKSCMWLYCSGKWDADRSVVLFEYQMTKEAKWPREFLRGYKGYLHVDGASTYEAAGLQEVTLVGCLSHARRMFVNALKAAPKGVSTWGTHAAKGLEFCDMLFDLEREYDEVRPKLTPEGKYAERQLYSRVVLDAFYEWMIKERSNVLPQSYTGKAIDYCLNQRSKLYNFLLDGRLEITNNRAERSIKSFAIGRKNFLFSNSQRGADASAVIYSIIETAKANNLKPFEYLRWLFEEMPNKRLTKENLRLMLPWSKSIPLECRLSLIET